MPGFLFNTGNGRTVFKRGVIKLNDSFYLIGGDTLRYNIGRSLSDASVVVDMVVKPNGNIVIGPGTDFGTKLHVNGDAYFNMPQGKYLTVRALGPSNYAGTDFNMVARLLAFGNTTRKGSTYPGLGTETFQERMVRLCF